MKPINYFISLCFFVFLSACATPAGVTQTNDLFVDAVAARATADAAAQQAHLQEQFLTGTAQAPIIHITETAAAQQIASTTTADAMVIQRQYWTVTAQSIQATETAAMTATAQAWTPTPNATTTAVFAQSYADATRVANSIIINNLDVERKRTTNQLYAAVPYVVGVMLLAVLLWLGTVYVRRAALITNPVDERGKPLSMANVIEGTAWDIDRAPNGMIGTGQSYLKRLPIITAERQDPVTARAQMVDLATRRGRLPQRLLEAQGVKGLLPEPTAESFESNFLLPSWDIINGWGGEGIPYYTARGLETIDIERFPHLSTLGITGTGKSRRFFRPLIACALATGDRVVIIGKSADYWPFEGHPNATLLKINKITEPGQAERYAKILEAIIVEMNRRDDVLTAAHQSTWTHAGRNRTWIILDELGNAFRLMDKERSNQCRIWVEGVVSEGRKMGFNVALANQRATGMASILSQTGKAIFRVEADEERAHRSLAGAHLLSDGYFLAKFGASQIAGSFEPTDEEIRMFLNSRPVHKVGDEDGWVEGVVAEQGQLPKPDEASLPASEPSARKAETLSSWVFTLGEKDMKVIELYQRGGMSNAEMEESAYGYTNGRTARRVKELIEKYRELNKVTTTTTTTTPENMPNLGFLPA